jgi:RND superfamily putative drug exporter
VLGRLGPLLVRHRRRVLAAWGLVLLVSVVVGGSVTDRLRTDAEGKKGTEAGQVLDRLDALGAGSPDVVGLVDGVPVGDPATTALLTAAVDDLRAIPGVVAVDSGATNPLLVATDGRAALVAVVVDPSLSDAAEDGTVEAVTAQLREIDAPNVLVGGEAVLAEESVHQSEQDLRKAELISLPIVLVLAIVIFGGLLAASLPLGIALVSVPGALLVLSLLTRVMDLHLFALNAATMLGLGLAVDYSLLMVNRFRDERAVGHDVAKAVERTLVTAGTTVMFSALTVAVALLGFVVFDNDVFRSIGLGGIGVVLFAMTAALTLLPAVLASFGHRIKPARVTARTGHYFHRIATIVQRRAALVATVVAVGLALLAIPFTQARLEVPGAESLPRSLETRQLYDQEQARFVIGGADPTTVIVDADAATLDTYVATIGALDGVRGLQVRPVAADGVTVIDVLPDGPAQGENAEHVVNEIRAIDAGARTQVGGPAAMLIDQREALFSRLPYAVAVIVIATFVLLFLLTGSVLIPLKAIVMNLLSLTATFGVLVWGFQQGHLSGVLDFDQTGFLALWLPFLVFFLAFGLSMDYEVFLLARIKEEWDRTGDNDAAVAHGLQRTGRIITSAALLIGVVFGAFATGGSLDIKAMGVGLTLAILIDATIVRTLLVPATMKLLGRANWWAPAPLRRLHERYGLHEAETAVLVVEASGRRGVGDGGVEVEAEVASRVLERELAAEVGPAVEGLVEERLRVGERTDRVREVGSPHHVVGGQQVGHLDRDGIPDDREVTMAGDVLARRELHPPATERGREDLVVVVHEVGRRRQPADVRLGEVEADVGEAVEDAGRHQLRHAEHR